MEEATIFEQRVSDEIESCVAKKKKIRLRKWEIWGRILYEGGFGFEILRGSELVRHTCAPYVHPSYVRTPAQFPSFRVYTGIVKRNGSRKFNEFRNSYIFRRFITSFGKNADNDVFKRR